MAKRNGARLAAVLPTDTQLYLRTNSSPFLNGNPYESSHALGVKNLKRIVS